jgi:hypothetical protein
MKTARRRNFRRANRIIRRAAIQDASASLTSRIATRHGNGKVSAAIRAEAAALLLFIAFNARAAFFVSR